MAVAVALSELESLEEIEIYNRAVDERRLKRCLKGWETRFWFKGRSLPIKKLIRMKWNFAMKYGWEAHDQLVREVELECSAIVIKLIDEARQQPRPVRVVSSSRCPVVSKESELPLKAKEKTFWRREKKRRKKNRGTIPTSAHKVRIGPLVLVSWPAR